MILFQNQGISAEREVGKGSNSLEKEPLFWMQRDKLPVSTEHLPFEEKIERISMPQETVFQRVLLSKRDPRVENVFLPIRTNQTPEEMGLLFGKQGKAPLLAEAVRRFLKTSPADGEVRRMPLTEKILSYMDIETYSKTFKTHIHHTPFFEPSKVKDWGPWINLLTQVRNYLTPEEILGLESRIQEKKPIRLTPDLVPVHVRRMMERFLIYQGPNCFHAALNFQNPLFVRSAYYNVRRELGHHSAMINYDELLRILERNFYPLDLRADHLRYGDVIIYADLPQDPSSFHYVDFRWIRHAATYLTSDYTFSKASKSADSPYTIKTLQEEWDTWNRLTQNLAVRVYRRGYFEVARPPRAGLTDWLY